MDDDLFDDDAVEGVPPPLPPSLCSFERRVCRVVVVDVVDDTDGDDGESASSPGVLLMVGARVECEIMVIEDGWMRCRSWMYVMV